MKSTDVVTALSALAHESRLAVFRLLVRRGPQGMAAGEMAERLGIPPATMSFHLSQLSHAGLVSSRREGRSIIYSADYPRMDALVGFLMDNCCAEQPGECCPTPTERTKKGKEERR
ncbi:MAG: metalloregulator ArsR/SmtB family transcription factor [Myxococcota bacterium]